MSVTDLSVVCLPMMGRDQGWGATHALDAETVING